MNKDLDKKLQFYIVNMAAPDLPFGSVWDSSAKKLSDTLYARGIKLPKKIYYEYKLPDNIKASDFLARLIKDYFVSNFFSSYAKRVLTDKKLTMSDKAKIFKYVWNNRASYEKMTKQYEIEIKKLNPELAHIPVKNSRSIVYGATFGFAPDEIEYFSDSDNRDTDAENKVIELLDKKYGINLTYVLAPKTAKIIIDALEQNVHYNNIAKER